MDTSVTGCSTTTHQKVRSKWIVEKVSPVTKNRAQFMISGNVGLFEFFIDQSWVMEKSDNVVAFRRDYRAVSQRA